jgi:cytochrome c oxidase subunit II
MNPIGPSALKNLAGPHAEKIHDLFWFITIVESVVGLLVLGVLFYAVWKRRRPNEILPMQPVASTERRLKIYVGTAIALTVLILTSFVGMSYAVDKELISLDKDPEIQIEVKAHQWWWEVRYPSANASEIFDTANEIHVPVGAKVRLKLQSVDVIHSMWFPNFNGKQDIIPGQERELVIRADKAGVWQGRCAEFCGLQHAQMGILLIAETNEEFEAWKKAQREPAAEPQTAEEKHGKEVFTKGACIMCHSIRTVETSSYSSNAPDLTHLKSRKTIGADSVPNTKGYLGGWIIDPHGIKPGVHMPTILQEPKDFQALLAYLETLK